MAGARHDGVLLVRSALGCATRVYVNVGNDITVQRATPGPEGAKSAAGEVDDTCVERVGIDVVVEHKRSYPTSPESCPSEKKGTAFARVLARSQFQLANAGVPEATVTG